jgi:alpha-amylase
MKTIKLIFGCHSHQPVGNFDFVFEEAFHKAYLPFIEVLERYPAVRVTLHYTGPLLDWFVANQPQFIRRLAALVESGQVEIMGGGYYEPLLCAIPERDAIAQIRRMQHFCEQHFGRTPQGMWLTERVWEPQMARTLANAGVEYTALDDTHFTCSGVAQDQLYGYYMTEDEGRTVKVFPILEKLRYLIPFHQVSESIELLRNLATEDGARFAVIHDDGEKFGIWPGTHHSVYEEGWLEEFFQALTDNREWLKSVTYSDYLQQHRAVGRTYLTCASYQEMMAWALPTSLQRRLLAIHEAHKQDAFKATLYGQFVQGGFWRGFLAKYDESNNIQKRMLSVSDRLVRIRETGNDSALLEEAEILLHEGQCNCAYWHGVFGGLYLNHLRTALYEKLIAADRILDQIESKDATWVGCESMDFDGDGNLEAVLENSHLKLFFSPADGGTLFEIDYKDQPFNFGNTLTRREEPYHDILRDGTADVDTEDGGQQSIHDLVKAKESGLDKYLTYDPYRRVSLRSHFFAEGMRTIDLMDGVQEDLGDFATAVYSLETTPESVIMIHEEDLDRSSGMRARLSKTISMAPDARRVEIRFDILNCGETALEARFGVEFAVNLLTGSAPDRYYRSDDKDLAQAQLGKRGVSNGLNHIALRDDWQNLECGFHFSAPAQVYRFALETVSQSESGQERVYQGSVVIPCWFVELASGATYSQCIQMEILSTTG